MTKRAIILSAGQGSRLLPLTADRPKCLIEFSGRTLLDWQLDMLIAGGIDDITVVVGFNSDMVDAALARRSDQAVVRTLFNPFYQVADNLGSVWLARALMDRPFLILNGDTLFSREIVARVLAAPDAPIRVTVDVKPDYDLDDMKVRREGERLLDIGKRLTAEESNAESIGFLRFNAEGAARFRAQVEQMMHSPEGTRSWYLRAIHHIAADPASTVLTTSIEGLEWGEVDFPEDVAVGQKLTAGWR
ncbi:sugar phosphate nucleotidyltransferase [Sphingosinicella soli]|uniref:Choline kinase n=1 Tax=Sphingosinicella soli TaxID=333708 RepID=A0A7W7F9Q9_9SPHN|nr:phosphocholine cytidylyltransferase family protein [Sphingosinicella soli]MBB4632903.1 choline kinase [Sphingosinicella soli]